ncbi:hypothetical protein GCM10027615_18040 [Plantactinospora veratri]
MSSDADSDQSSSAEGYVQRAELLAELGRYDEAAAEVGFAIALDPSNVQALVMLAMVRLAGDKPEEALTAADSAVAAAPELIHPLVIRGHALADLRRFRRRRRRPTRSSRSAPTTRTPSAARRRSSASRATDSRR